LLGDKLTLGSEHPRDDVSRPIAGRPRCGRCGGRLRVIASIDQAPVIERILDHLACPSDTADLAHASRAPPTGEFPF
jgi:hypothetical protein